MRKGCLRVRRHAIAAAAAQFFDNQRLALEGDKGTNRHGPGQLVLSKGCSGCAPFKLFLETGELNLLSLFSKCSSNDLALLVLVLVPVVVEVVVSSQ